MNEIQTESKYRLAADKAAMIRTAPPAIMSVAEAAAYLCISPRKLRDLLSAGRIRYARLGSKIILKKEYLDAAVQAA